MPGVPKVNAGPRASIRGLGPVARSLPRPLELDIQKVVQFMKEMALPLLFGILLIFGGLAGCSESILRDDYMGKSLLQPDNVPGAVRRDEKGNPILD